MANAFSSFIQRVSNEQPRVSRTLRALRVGARERFRDGGPPLAGGFIPYFGYGLHYGVQGPELLRQLQTRYGDVFTLRLLGKHITFCLAREYVEYLYEAPYDEVSFLDGLRLFPGFGSVIRFDTTGPEDANVGLDLLRKYLAPRVNETTAQLDHEVRLALAQHGSDGSPFELRRDLGRAIVQLSARLLMGPVIARKPAFLDAVMAFDLATQGMVKGVFSKRPLEHAARMRDDMERHLLAELARRRAEPRAGEGDLVDAFLVARASDGRTFSDAQIASDLGGYMFATTANTPAAAAMCLHHILRDSALRARVEAELDEVRTSCHDLFDTQALKRLSVLDACLNETLRVYAPGIHLRMLRQETRVGNYVLPAGELIGLSPYVLHRDPSAYSDPDLFDPDRFLAGPRTPGKKPAALHFVPFGRGLHACIGRTLARTEVLLTVARALTDLKPTLHADAPPFAIDWGTAGLGVPDRPVFAHTDRQQPPASAALAAQAAN